MFRIINLLPSQCLLALTLATSTLDLPDTPWLHRSWDTQRVCIVTNEAGNLLPSKFHLSKTSDPGSGAACMSKYWGCVNNENVFALGLILLELSRGQFLHSLQDNTDLAADGSVDSFTKISAAMRLAKEIRKHEMVNYADAVQRCVWVNFETSAFDFHNHEFREKYFQGVVLPLREDYKHVTGKTPWLGLV